MSIFEPCWSIWGGFWKGFGSQNPPKIDPKSIKNQFKNYLKNWCHFDSPLEPNMMPKLPRHVPKPPHVAQFWTPKGGARGSNESAFRYFFGSWCPLGAKMAPIPLQDGPKSQFYKFFNDFYWIFIAFLLIFVMDFCLISNRFSSTFVWHLFFSIFCRSPKVRGGGDSP